MNYFLFFLSLSAFYIPGYFTLKFLKILNRSKIINFIVGVIIGKSIVTFLIFTASVCGAPLDFTTFLAVYMAVTVIMVTLACRSGNDPIQCDDGYLKSERGAFKYLRLAFLILLAFQIVQLIQLNLKTPVAGYPDCAINAFKAKIIYYEGGALYALVIDPEKIYMHPDYPLDFPLLLSWTSFCMGDFDDTILKLIPLIFGIFALFLFYYLVLSAIGQTLALALVCILLSDNTLKNVSFHFYSENILLCHVLVGVYYFKTGLNDKNCANARYIFASLLFLAAGTCVKNEGILFFAGGAIAALIYIIRKKIPVGREVLIPLFLCFLVRFHFEWVPILC